jgi:uncharacterized protein
MEIFVQAKPNAKKPGIQKINKNHFIVLVKEPPIKGMANRAIIKALADYFEKPQSGIRIISGFTSCRKTIEIL